MDVSPLNQADVLLERQGSLGWIRLNRASSLNSLTLDMIRSIAVALDRFQADAGIAAVLISGEGARGFCAGGDIRALRESGLKQDGTAETFWREEYRLNRRIARFSKPYVAIMDGITMGGGVGLSAHGSHRIVTERSRVAMPEVGIGYVPDVGGSWLLSREPSGVGMYLGLTGRSVGAQDAIYAGLADWEVPSSTLGQLIEALAGLEPGVDPDTVRDVISPYSVAGMASLMAQTSTVRAMAKDGLEAILAALHEDGSEFARDTGATLLTRSPTSLEIAYQLLRRGRTSASLEECLERELAAALLVLSGHDFYEGVRAAVIDKDRDPRWAPASLEAVDRATIARCLSEPLSEPIFDRAIMRSQ